MKEFLLCIFFIFFLFPMIYNSIISPYSTTSDIEMLVIGKKFILFYNNTQEFTITEKDSNEINKNYFTIIKNKKLIQINESNFVLFGMTRENKFCYNIYDLKGNSIMGDEFNIPITVPSNYTIKIINESDYILYFFNEKDSFYLYELKFPNNVKGGKKKVDLLGKEMDSLNTIECDSFDGNYFFCAFSETYRDDRQLTILSFYSFENIEKDKFERKELENNAAGPSLLKIEQYGKKEFIVCHVKTNKLSSIFCQSLLLEKYNIIKDKIFLIGQISKRSITSRQFYMKNPIISKKYKYSIYTLVLFEDNEITDNTITVLYISSLDFGINIPLTPLQDADTKEKKDLLVNDYYIVFLKYKSENEIDVYIDELKINCPQNELFNLTGIDQLDITNKIVETYLPLYNDYLYQKEVYLSFSLDAQTYLYVGDSKNNGDLLNRIEVFHDINKLEIKLIQNPNLRISENYYIFHNEYVVDTSNYKIVTNFCFFKILNCYESCKECNINIPGSIESHQCSKCNDGYNIFLSDKNEEGYFNCYKQNTEQVKGYYYQDGLYYKCDDSCDECDDGTSCKICKEGYYFILEKLEFREGTPYLLNDICYKLTPDNYFLDSENFIFNGKKINLVYKKCYETCYSCFGEGNEKENKCLTCKIGYIKYPYDSTKCTKNASQCTYFWELNESNNNIECSERCSGYIVHQNLYSNISKSQCVQNCQSIFNPFDISRPKSLLTYICDDQKYCITKDYCELKNLLNNEKECIRSLECFNMDDYTKIEDNSELDPDSVLNKIDKRVKLIKYFEFENIKFSDFGKNFIQSLMEKYKIDYTKEINEHKGEYLGGIDFITSTNYNDSIVTIYPLQVEDYVYKNVFEMNNLCSVNFTNFFKQINYKVGEKNYIIIGLIEHKNENIPINFINYFFFIYNDNYNIFSLLKNLNVTSNKIDVTYPLYNFENQEIDKKYSTNLIDTIKKLHSFDSDIIFYDKDNKIFNDICYTFSSNKYSDMTIEDRINEYLIQLSLCENNCTLIELLNKEEYQNPRSLCQCQFKNEIILSNDNYTFIHEIIKIKKVLNINALKCVKEVFSSKKLAKNFIFWIFIPILIILIIIFIKIIFCTKIALERQLKIKNPNKIIKRNSNHNPIENFDKNIANNFDEQKYKSVKILEISKNSDINIINLDDDKKKRNKTSINDLSNSSKEENNQI